MFDSRSFSGGTSNSGFLNVKNISVCILTKNNERTLARCLEPLLRFGEIVVLDTGSEDSTLEILAGFPSVRVIRQDGIGNFGKSRNHLAAHATHDWILMVDADEILTGELVDEILALPDDPETVYAILRINHYRGRPIRACGWYPDYCFRLYHRKATSWKERIVHEVLLLPETVRTKRLTGEMSHFSCEDAIQLAGKGFWYAELFGTDFAGKRRTFYLEAYLRAAWTFFRCYFLRRGVFYGRDGLTISSLSAFGSYMKYAILYEKNEALERSADREKNPEIGAGRIS